MPKDEDRTTSTELKDLITQRSSVKGRLTKFKNYIDTISNLPALSNIQLTELNLKLDNVKALSNKFDTLQSQIEILNPSNISDEINERDAIEQNFVAHIAMAQNIIDSNKGNSDSFQDFHNSFQCHHDQHSVGFKLPQIQIAKFDGSYFRWLEFRDTFSSLVHDSEHIKPIHKFHYLVSYLEGDAARVISNLEISETNYKDAWRLLCDRYDNKRLLIDHHINSLFNIDKMNRQCEKSLRFLVDHITKNLRALSGLGQPTDKWDVLIIYMVSSKLDNQTIMKWEEYRNTLQNVPTLEQFNKFLIDRADVLEALNRNKPETKPSHVQSSSAGHSKPNKSNIKTFTSVTQDSPKTRLCVVCNEDHRIYDCPTFKSKSIKDRIAEVAKLKLCSNCLRLGHYASTCRLGPCRECKRRHNSLLHIPNNQNVVSNTDQTNNDTLVNFAKQHFNQILLSTAIVEVMNPHTKRSERVRALLDCGSQSSFISQSLKQKLSLNSHSINALNVIGIGNSPSNNVTESCTAQIKSIHKPFAVTLRCLVLQELTGELPKTFINVQSFKIPKDIQLADPQFNEPATVDLLIGADIFWDILGCEQRSLGSNNPKLHSSQLGWLIAGPIQSVQLTKSNYTNVQCNHVVIANTSCNNIDNQLLKFWELEELPQNTILSQEEKACEKHFLTHTSRLSSGRFSVKLPLIDSPDCLGDSYNLAKKRFLYLEKRFRKQPTTKEQYVNFITEYAELGHLSECPTSKPYPSYYLCHHAVFKEKSESTKIRVVFDGSARTSSGLSINDIQMIGPNIQDSLFSILIRARQYKFIITGDIEKMYRQIEVNQEDRNLQLILWREDESMPFKTLQLNTVTYGFASASYLSTRCLYELGEECSDCNIKTIIQHDFYCDDLITGADTVEQLSYILNSVTSILKSGCFNLRKFRSNNSSIFQSSNINLQENLCLSQSSTTLGLGWNPSTDVLHFSIDIPDNKEKITKRYILSSIFRIFDPLGLLSPCVIKPKMIIQQL